MIRKLLILIGGLWGAAAVALPCPTCPKQMLYLPTYQVALLPDTVKDTPKAKVKPSKKTEDLPDQAPAYTPSGYQGNNTQGDFTSSDPKYSHRARNLGLDKAQTDHSRYVYDMRKFEAEALGSMAKRK